MAVFQRRMPSGIPGAISRLHGSSIEPQTLNSALPFPFYGTFGKIVAGRFVPLVAGDAVTVIYGLLVRSYPTTNGVWNNGNAAFGNAVPLTVGIASVMRRGYMTVLLGGATPAAIGAQVYVRIAAPAAGKPIGGIEAAADSTNTLAVPNCTFMSTADANGNVEIVYNA